MLTVRLLGPLAVEGPDPIAFSTRKTAMLFAILAFNVGKSVSRETVRNLLWSDRGDAQSSGSLRRALSDVRRLLEMHGADAALQTTATAIKLAADQARVDVRTFVDLARGAGEESWLGAAETYRGDLLSDAHAIDPGFDDWLRVERQAVRSTAVRLVERLSECASTSAAFDATERLALQLLRTDAACEEAHRAVMRIFIHRGRRNAALKQYAACVEALREQLGAEPEEATQSLFRAAKTHTTPPRDAVERTPDAADQIQAFAPKPKIAVLPFECRGPAAEQDFIASGIAEDLIVELSRISDYDVISRQSTLSFGVDSNPPADLHAELGATYAIQGSVLRADDRVRVTARLVEPRSGEQVWADHYDREIGGIFDLQDEITAAIVDTIDAEIRVHQRERAVRRHPDNLDAWEQFQRGMHFLYGRTHDDADRAETCFRRAIDLAPAFAAPHAGLASVNLVRAILNLTDDIPGEIDRSIAHARRAIDLRPTDSYALTTLGRAMIFSGDLENARELLERAIAENPSHAQAYFGLGHALFRLGRGAAAIDCLDRGLSLSPKDPLVSTILALKALCLYAGERFDEAESVARSAMRLRGAEIWPRIALAISLVRRERPDEAAEVVRDLLSLDRSLTCAKLGEMMAHARARDRERVTADLIAAGLPAT